jgi:hypothetical protein
MQQLIVDNDGDWFLNKGQYPFIDPTTGVRFEPNVKVQVKETAWIKSQPVLEKQPKEKAGK